MRRAPYAFALLLLVSALTALGADSAGAQNSRASRQPKPSHDLRIVTVDVEGGSAILFVTPEGKSLLIDTGWAPGAGGQRPPAGLPRLPAASSADKILAAAHAMGVGKIDYLILTHYHADHLGGFQSLMDKIEIDNFVDHGPNTQMDNTETAYQAYASRIAGKPHIVPKAGDTLDIGSMHIRFVAVATQVISNALPEGGQPNPDCAGVQTMARDGGIENSYSVASLITFGKTRIAAFGDLPWNGEIKLLCPTNKVGPIDLYFVTQHGMDLSSSPPTRALDPIVSIMGNGAIKGGDEAPMKMIASYAYHDQAVWLLHDTIRYPALNPDANFIANLDWVPDQNYTLTAAITPEGQITVTNGRNNFSRTYKARGAQP